MDVQSHFNASDTDRKSWSRQRKNALSGEFAVPELIQFFSLSEEEGKILQHNIQQVNIRLTPYVIQLIQEVGDALKKQLLPIYHKIDALPPSLWDDSFRDEEFISHAQNKYADSRVLVRIAHLCDSFCQFCFQAERTLNPESPGHGGEAELDQVTKYISTHPTISEIILSGGDPMTLGNRTLKKYLQKIRSISRAANDPLLIRINTRNLTFNPYRFDEEFAKLCHEYGVNSLGIHATHP